MIDYCEGFEAFQDIQHLLQVCILYPIFIVRFYKIVIKFRSSFFPFYSLMYLLLAVAYQCITWHIPPLILLSTINNISISVNNSIFVIFKHAFHANPGADKTWAGSSTYISIHLLRKLLNKSASNNMYLQTLLLDIYWNAFHGFCYIWDN